MIRTQPEWEAAATPLLDPWVTFTASDGLPGHRAKTPQELAAATWDVVAPLVAAVEQAEQTIRDAPHAEDCHVDCDTFNCWYCLQVNGPTCSCWKSSALTREGSNG